MKKLRIAQVTSLYESVPPQNKAGLEQLVYYLTEELVKLGHEVTLFATADSNTSAKLVPIWPKAVSLDPYGQILPLATYTTWSVSEAFIRAKEFDIIHSHTSWVAGHFAGAIETPVLTTLHHPVTLGFVQQYPDEYQGYFDQIQEKHFALGYDNAISKFQATKLKRPTPVVYNGIPMNVWNSYSYEPGEYFAFLGYISGNKGVAEAIQAVLPTDEKLIIAGPVDEHDLDTQKYFAEEVQPYIDNDQIVYLGPLDHSEKMEFLKKAKATLMPIQWDEPFGLVAIESLACGTPVIAWDRGAMPEIIIDGTTGFLVNSVAEMTKKLSQVDSLLREESRNHVIKNFSAQAMAKNYLSLYEKIIADKKSDS